MLYDRYSVYEWGWDYEIFYLVREGIMLGYIAGVEWMST